MNVLKQNIACVNVLKSIWESFFPKICRSLRRQVRGALQSEQLREVGQLRQELEKRPLRLPCCCGRGRVVAVVVDVHRGHGWT